MTIATDYSVNKLRNKYFDCFVKIGSEFYKVTEYYFRRDGYLYGGFAAVGESGYTLKFARLLRLILHK